MTTPEDAMDAVMTAVHLYAQYASGGDESHIKHTLVQVTAFEAVRQTVKAYGRACRNEAVVAAYDEANAKTLMDGDADEGYSAYFVANLIAIVDRARAELEGEG